MTELAQRFQINQTAVVGLVNRCEEQGLVKRRYPAPGQPNSRYVYVSLTAKANRLLTELHSVLREHRQAVREFFKAIDWDTVPLP